MVLDWGPSIITVLSISLVSPLWGQGYGHRAFKDHSKSQTWPFLNYEVLILPWKMLFCITQASHEKRLLIYTGKHLAGKNNFMTLLMFMGHNGVGCVLVYFGALTQVELALKQQRFVPHRCTHTWISCTKYSTTWSKESRGIWYIRCYCIPKSILAE